MMGKLLNLETRIFGRLVVISRAGSSGNGGARWLCRCDLALGGCGKVIECSSERLLFKNPKKDCGCLRRKDPDITGKIFGRLTALFRHEKNTHGIVWKCQCICGEVAFSYLQDLQSSHTRSCGCYSADRTSNCNKLEYPWMISRNSLISDYKKIAKKKGLSFELCTEDFQQFFKGNCNYCGVAPYNIVNKYLKKDGSKCKPNEKHHMSFDINAANYIYNGIDRIDNSLGYTLENSVSCCKPCNYAKRSLTLNEWLIYLSRLTSFQLSNNFAFLQNQIQLSPSKIPEAKIKSFKSLIKEYKNNAETRGLYFDLLDADCDYFFQGNCSYCGIKPTNVKNFSHISKKDLATLNLETTYIYNGLDRIDSNLGYTKNNCVSCCKQCNFSKKDMPFETWQAWLKRLTRFRSQNREVSINENT